MTMESDSDLLFTDENCSVPLSGDYQETLDGQGPPCIDRKLKKSGKEQNNQL